MILLLFCLCMTTAARYKPRCNLDFSFSNDINLQKSSNKISWERKCSQNVESICIKNITVAYFSMPPFTDNNTFGANNWPGVVLTQIISAALSQCCGSCLQITFNKLENQSQLISNNNKYSIDIIFPIFTQRALNRVESSSTIPVIKLSAALFFTKLNILPTMFAQDIFRAIYSLWPLFGVSTMLAYVAGVIIWFLDTWYNKEQLPRRFIPGSFEGFWWAFVTMVAVGYGDIAPRGVIAKLFAMFWILCGVTITSFMTAGLTNVVFEVTDRYLPSVYSGDIGVLTNHIFEKELLLKGNAKQHSMNTINELINSLNNKNEKPISGFVLDSYSAKNYFQEQISNSNFFISDVIQDVDQSYYGVVINDVGLNELVIEYLDFQKDKIDEFVYDSFNNFIVTSSPIIQSNLLFTTQSGIFKYVLIVSACLITVLFAFGAVFELCLIKSKSSKVNSSLNITVYVEEEIKIEKEMKLMAKKWQKKLNTKLTNFIVDGTFKIQHDQKPTICLKINNEKVSKTEEKEIITVKTSLPLVKMDKKTFKSKNANIVSQNDFCDYISKETEAIKKQRPLPRLQVEA
ncbi:uncharacterized protein LOC101240683 isoform X1 [Hydra vulgaris]|uniref:Uncharacterized protein LOC101240683 isoform X1 n=1 Tax=Hydra vulgaris TaxID=6087 RepID=A0ABM4DAG8_HYDVU